MVLNSQMIQGQGELAWVSLGTVTLTPQRIELWCISKERLERGKKRLAEVLGHDIQYQRDYYEDMLSKARRMPQRAASLKEEELQEKYLPLYSKTMSEWATRWVDEKIPALDGKTP